MENRNSRKNVTALNNCEKFSKLSIHIFPISFTVQQKEKLLSKDKQWVKLNMIEKLSTMLKLKKQTREVNEKAKRKKEQLEKMKNHRQLKNDKTMWMDHTKKMELSCGEISTFSHASVHSQSLWVNFYSIDLASIELLKSPSYSVRLLYIVPFQFHYCIIA